MKKVVCPQCGLVNLEKFVTFPHCAACGALLTAGDEQKTPVWRRPVLAPLWASLVGLCCVALAIMGLSIARETRREEEKSLILYVQLPSRSSLGQKQIVQFSLDSTAGDTEASTTQFNDVRLRLSHTTLDNFTIEQIMPMPDTISSVGNGRYLQWNTIRLEQPIRFLIAPRRTGEAVMTFSLLAQGFQPFLLRRKMYVTRAASAKLPNLTNQVTRGKNIYVH